MPNYHQQLVFYDLCVAVAIRGGCAVGGMSFGLAISRVHCSWCLSNGHHYWVHYILARVHRETATDLARVHKSPALDSTLLP